MAVSTLGTKNLLVSYVVIVMSSENLNVYLLPKQNF